MFLADLKKYFRNIFLSILIVLGITFGGINICHAGDLMNAVFDPMKDYDFMVGTTTTKDNVGSRFFNSTVTVSIGDGIEKKPSVIVMFTKLLLMLVIALSVTMILYNGLKIIITTGQGKDDKNFTNNMIFIIVGIIISLFSVTIISFIQSISKTVDDELGSDHSESSFLNSKS